MTNTTLITKANIFTGDAWLEDHSLLIHHEKIIAIYGPNNSEIQKGLAVKFADKQITQVDYSNKLIVPGFIDTQVNGGNGLLFNDAPSLSTLETLSKTHSRFGTCGFLPTLITDDWSVVEQAIASVNRAIALKVPGVLGIHLEGPFLNPERKGVHASEKMLRLDASGAELIQPLENGKMLLTLAPELTTTEIIRKLVQKNILVAAGHTAANYEQTKEALAAGIVSFTHLFNAMTPMTSREPGVVGAALEDKNSWCSLIVDGFHVHPATLKTACAAKPKDKLVLVTDSMPSVGADNKNFELYGEKIFYNNGKLTNTAGTLAGSDLSMIDAVKNAITLLDLPKEQAFQMASSNPAAMLGLDKKYGKIAENFNASFVVLTKKLDVAATWIDGKVAHLA